MPIEDDLQHLASASDKVAAALEDDPRGAAKILCDEFEWLLNENGSFWERVPNVASELEPQYRKQEHEVLRNITHLIDQEGAILAKLKVKNPNLILKEVYGSMKVAQLDLPNPAAEGAFENLRKDLGRATERICHESNSAFRRGMTNLLGWKGLKVLTGAASVTANAMVALTADGGAISWVSISAGFLTIKGSLDDINQTPQP